MDGDTSRRPPQRLVDGLQIIDETAQLEWDRLCVATGASPFSRPGWVRVVCEAIGDPGPTTGVVVRRGEALTGVLPLTSSCGIVRGYAVRGEEDSWDVISADSDAAAQVISATLDLTFRQLELVHVPADGTIATAVSAAARERRMPVLRRVLRRCPFVDTTGSWQDYEKNHLGASRRKSIRRRWRRLGELGDAQLEVVDGDRDDIDQLVTEGFRVEDRSWKADEHSSVLSGQLMTDLYTQGARWAAEAGILRLFFVRLNGRAIGFQLAFQQGRVLHAVKIGSDREYAKYAPGILVFHGMIEYAFAHPDIDEVHVSGRDEAYKMEFAHGAQEQQIIQVFPSTLRGRLDAGACVTRRRMGRAVRRLPEPTERLVRAAAGAIRRTKPGA